MANYILKFQDLRDFQKTIEVYTNSQGRISIALDDDNLNIIDLDISTAIKFSKTLRTEINKAKEVQNG